VGELARVCLVVGVISCGGARSSQPQPDLDKMVMYEPFAARSEAKRPNQAIIHGTDEHGGSTVIKLASEPQRAVADAMGVRVKLETGPNADGTVRVGIFEDRIGANQQWRASVWVAALVAAHTLNKDLTDFTFSATSTGEIEGPSASGLIAAGFLATMTGAAIDPTATVAGAVNADGTIGPVAGLADKVKAALAAGTKKLGYPSGMRVVHVDAKTTVDIVELAKASGAVAVEVGDVYEAYKLITGKTLLAPAPMALADMALDATTAAALDGKYKAWQARLVANAPTMAKLATGPLQPLAQAAKRASDSAARLYAKGAIGGAFPNLVAAWILTSAAVESADVLDKVRAGDLAGARSALATVEGQLDSRALQTISEQSPSTIGAHILLMGAFQTALRGSGLASLARYYLGNVRAYLDNLAGKPAKPDELAAVLMPAELLMARSIADSAIAVERLEVESVKTLSYMCSIPNVRQLAMAFRSSSSAVMSYLDALLVDSVAAKDNISSDEARMRLAASEPDYLVAYALSHLEQVAEDIKQALGESSIAWNLMLLAGAERAYVDAAQMTAKYYSFAPASFAAEVDREHALAQMLVHAERAARMSARSALVATGGIPVQAKIAYQLAVSERDGDTAEQLDALAGFWSATTYSHTAVMLARN
jgi:uncharacterized protein